MNRFGGETANELQDDLGPEGFVPFAQSAVDGLTTDAADTFAPLEQLGVKFDGGKPRWDLLPPDALDDVAKVLTYGAAKYAPRNWEKGMDWGRLIAAQMRHLAAFQSGEDVDPESGLHHLAHASCCALMVHALFLRGAGSDDRSEYLEKREGRE